MPCKHPVTAAPLVGLAALAASLFANLALAEATAAPPPPAATAPAPDRKLDFDLKLAGQVLALADLGTEQLAPFGLDSGDDLRFGIRRLSIVARASALGFVTLKGHFMSEPATRGASPELAGT